MAVLNIGLDVGSTTIKVVVMNELKQIIYSDYQRHYSDTKNVLCDMLNNLLDKYKDNEFKITLTGSGALDASNKLDIEFIQEVISCKASVSKYIPKTDVVIELGGEDAKIIYFGNSIEQRMNGTCAGGTGAFLDQMATLLNTDAMGLNELAKDYKTIYPIASRCGVFAKTDIQPLINEGVKKEDLAASIFQAVVNQTISGLACGRPIKGNVAFLGGPLNYLSELKNRFIDTLKLKNEEIIISEEPHLFVAKGASLAAFKTNIVSKEELKQKINEYKYESNDLGEGVKPLFVDNNEYQRFKKRHSLASVKRKDLSSYKGDAFIGIDAGSTTTKLILTDNDDNILYTDYGGNEGNPLKSVMKSLKKLYKEMPEGVIIRYSGVTGYGEKLIESGLKIDMGEVETIAHYAAAKKFKPDVTSIVDIGGQDMKYIKIKNGVVDNIMLNEACSSGCGSFIETYAINLNLTLEEFVNVAIKSDSPVDLGSRCTVFMNSKIKEAQKEGYKIGDIASGLANSVVNNALLKVMKIRDISELGENILVQGGTFYNDAVLKAFEDAVQKEVVRPDIAGLMGAYGMSILAKEKYRSIGEKYFSTILNIEKINNLTTNVKHTNCNLCENKCKLSINKFNDSSVPFITGNKCERGAGQLTRKRLPNMVKYKNERLFNYESNKLAPRGQIGIPRILNIYEDYPFWHTFFTSLGFEVVLSEKTTRKTYEKGMESMPSESVCYPAKLAHGHIESLIAKNIKTIFYPAMIKSRKEVKNAENNFNCPIVISYSEVIKNNVKNLEKENVKFMNPFLPFDTNNLAEIIYNLEEFKEYNFTKKELKKAALLAEKEYFNYKKDIKNKGKEYLEYINQNNLKAIVLASRPYQIDSEINHNIDSLITSLDLCVLTEDSITLDNIDTNDLRVVNQWVYHSRLYRAAHIVGQNKNLELVQLNSFGCGLDAVTSDQVEEILKNYGKMFTLIKIDEINNLGAARIRLRSLKAAMERKVDTKYIDEYIVSKEKFTKNMQKDYTILIPQMAPIHFKLIEEVFNFSGYKVKLLEKCTAETVNVGLKHVNNDACYPSLLVTGQLIEALKSGDYDINKTAVMMSQTGGGCRATNYISFIRKALKDAGLEQVPVISFSAAGLEKNPGFKITLPMLLKLYKAVTYGDLLQKMLLKNRANELNKGQSENLFNEWMSKCKKLINSSSTKEYSNSLYEIVSDFEKIEFDNINRPKVGIVGEILVKYHPFGNNNLVGQLENLGAEVTLPDLMGFVKYSATGKITTKKLLNESIITGELMKHVIKIIEYLEKDLRKALGSSNKNYLMPTDIFHLMDKSKDILSDGNRTGEGWYLTAEMIEYIENDIGNIVCAQPFACLPNHVVGKGVIGTLKTLYPNSNIVPIDYDPGTSEANQINRIKLMLSVANDNLLNNSVTKFVKEKKKNTQK